MVGLLLCGTLVAQVPVVPADSETPFSDAYQGAFATRDMTFRFQYETERYGLDNGQFGIGLQGHRPADSGLWLYMAQFDMNFGQTKRTGVNVGLGRRWLMSDILGTGRPRVYGAALWYDGLKTDIENYFNQIGFSLESLGDKWDFRANGNFVVGRQTQQGEPVRTGQVGYWQQYLTEVTRIPTDEAISVIDLEGARRIANYDAWIIAGGYGLDASGDTCFGGKVGARGWIGRDVQLELVLTQDDFFDTTVSFSVVWYPGRSTLFGNQTRCINDRLRDPFSRNNYIATRRTTEYGGIPLHDEDGYRIRVIHVDSTATSPGDGTYENPYTSLNSVYGGSQEGDIILVHSGTTYTGEAIVLRDLQRLLGEGGGIEHLVMTDELAEVRLPESSPGAWTGAIPEINDAPSVAVTLGTPTQTTIDVTDPNYDSTAPISTDEVSNLAINGGVTAIKSSAVGIGEADINHMTISDTTGNAIELKPIVLTFDDDGVQTKASGFNPSITDTTFSGIGGDDINLDAATGEPSTTNVSEAIVIRGVTSSDGNGWGINILNNQNSATIDQYTYDGGTTALGGIRFESSSGGGEITTTYLTGGSTAADEGYGVSLYSNVTDTFTSEFTFTNVEIEDTGGAGFHVSGGDVNVDFTGKITQGNDAPAVLVEATQDSVDPTLYSYHTGTLDFNAMTTGGKVVEATAGTGLVFRDANGVYNFNSLVSLSNVITGIDISNTEANAGGLFTFNEVSIVNPNDPGTDLGAGLRITGGASTVNFTGLIQQTSGDGYAVDISGGHAGTVIFNQKETDEGVIIASDGNGLRFADADGTYTFTDKIVLSNAVGSVGTDAHAGIDITTDGGEGSDGTFTISNVEIDSIEGVAFNLTGGTADVAFVGKINQTANNVAVVTINGGHAAGTEADQGSGVVTFKEKVTGEGIITATTGSGLVFGNVTSPSTSDGANGTYTFTNLINLDDVSTGIDIQKSTGKFTFTNVAIDDATTAAFRVNGSTANVNFTGQITQDAATAGTAVYIHGQHSGTINFNEFTQNSVTKEGAIIASTGSGLVFNQADGTYNFNWTSRDSITTDAVSLSGTAGVALTDCDGTFNFEDITITNSSIVALSVNGGTADIDFNGKITKTSNGAVAAVEVSGGHSGTLEFTEIQTGQGVVQASVGPGLVFGGDGVTTFGAANGTYTFNYNGSATTNTYHAVELSGDSGVAITNSDGTFNFEDITITNSSIDAITVAGGQANVNVTGKITADPAAAVKVTYYDDGTTKHAHTGTVTLNELTTDSGIIAATGGDGLVFGDATDGGADGTYLINDKITLSGGAGVSIANSDGTFTLSSADSTITNTSGTAFSVDGGEVTVNYAGKIISSGTGQAVNIQNLEDGSSVTLSGKLTLNDAAGISIADSKGTIAFSSADSTITNTSGTAFSVDRGEATITYAGKIASSFYEDTVDSTQNTVGQAVSIQNIDGGTITFSGKITSDTGNITAGSSPPNAIIEIKNNNDGAINFNGNVALNSYEYDAVTLTDNNDATVTFGKLDIDTTSGDGFVASGSGTIAVTNSSSTIDTTTGTALSLSDVKIGSGGITFSEVSANGAVNGIMLNNLTGSGSLTINGGTIQNTTGHGVSITNVADVSLNNMLITNIGDGAGVDYGVYLAHDNTKVFNVTISDCTISNPTTSMTGASVYLNANGSGSMNLTLDGNTITQSTANRKAVDLNVGSSANKTYITLDGNNISQTAAAGINQQALSLSVATGTCYFEATNNSFNSKDTTQLGTTGQYGASFDAQVTGGTLNATVHDNTFDSDTPSASSTTARGFRMAAVGGSVKLSLLDNIGSADSGAAPFLCYKNSGSSFGIELLKTPDATDITDKTPEVNVRNGGSGTYDDYVNPPNTTPAQAGWVIEFLPDTAPLTPPMDLGFGNLSAGAVPTP